MRIEQLTFTRFVAAVTIVIFHYGRGSDLFNHGAIHFLFRQANLGVSYFFVLSGFVMIIAYNRYTKISFADYFKNRFARIYPVYFLACLLFLLELVTSKEIDWWVLFLNLFMIQAWVPGQALSFNYPGWSVSVEVFFYILFPFLFNLVYRKIAYKKLIVAVLLIWIASQVVINIMVAAGRDLYLFSSKDLLYFPLMHLNEFLAGNLAGLYFVNAAKVKRRNLDRMIVVAALLIILVLRYPSGLIYHNGFLVLLFVPLILLLSFNTGKLTDILNRRIFVFLGEISFGLYILQFPVWSWVSNVRLEKYFHIDRVEDFTLSFLIRFSCLLLLSALSYVYFEAPIRKWFRKFSFRFSPQATN